MVVDRMGDCRQKYSMLVVGRRFQILKQLIAFSKQFLYNQLESMLENIFYRKMLNKATQHEFNCNPYCLNGRAV